MKKIENFIFFILLIIHGIYEQFQKGTRKMGRFFGLAFWGIICYGIYSLCVWLFEGSTFFSQGATMFTAIAAFVLLEWFWWIFIALLIFAPPFCYNDGDYSGGAFLFFSAVAFWSAHLYMTGVPFTISLGTIGLYVAYDLLIGTTWSIFRWFLMIRDFRVELREIIKDWDSDKNRLDIEERINKNLRAANTAWKPWADLTNVEQGKEILDKSAGLFKNRIYNMSDNSALREGKLFPRLTHKYNRDRLASWILFWPFSMIDFFFRKLLREVIDGIINTCKAIYNSITKSMLKGLTNNET